MKNYIINHQSKEYISPINISFKKIRHFILDYNYIFLMIIIFALALFLRLLDLENNLPGLYNDELYFLLSAYTQLHHIGYLTVPGFNLRDFIFYIINGYIPSIILFHTNPFSARFPVALYGSLMVFPLYLLSKELLNNKKMALIAALLWGISPSAVVTSRVGYGVEIFPLFLFLFFLFSWIKFINYNNLKYLAFFLTLFVIILYFPSIRVYALIPVVGTVIYTLLPLIESKIITGKYKSFTHSYYVFSFLATIGVIWVGLIIAKEYLSSLLGPVKSWYILTNMPFMSFRFFLRLGYALAPWKMFWLDEFTSIGLNYGSPVFVPSLLIFTLPFLYASVFLIPTFYKNDKAILNSYYLILGYALFGLLTPIFNTTNLDNMFEPSEGIFALPFYCMLVAFSLYVFLKWASKSLKQVQDKVDNSHNHHVQKRKKFNTRTLSAILISIIIILATINVASFVYDLNASSEYHYKDNTNSLNYIFYGWYHVTEYMLSHNFTNVTLYYTSGVGGAYDLTNVNNFNYWFYHQNFPLYWLYAYSEGKITKIYPLYHDALPPIPRNFSIILSQNVNYTKILKANGYRFKVLYTVYRANGKPAIQVIELENGLNNTEIS
ncbi:MAG: hypothetical protein ACP5U0_09745, partial [Caldisphaera sp.]